jgi:hypothetical protein
MCSILQPNSCNSVYDECIVATVLYCIVNDNVIYGHLAYLLMYICFWIVCCFIVDMTVFLQSSIIIFLTSSISSTIRTMDQ